MTLVVAETDADKLGQSGRRTLESHGAAVFETSANQKVGPLSSEQSATTRILVTLLKLFSVILKFLKMRKMNNRLQAVIGQILHAARTVSAIRANVDSGSIFWIVFPTFQIPLLYLLRRRYPHNRIVIDTDSVWSRFLLRGVPHVGLKDKIPRILRGLVAIIMELAFVRVATIITTVSAVDQAYYRNLRGRAKIEVFSNIVTSIPDSKELDRPVIPTFDLLLPGFFGDPTSPMNTGATWFLEKIWPLVLDARPLTTLLLMGRNSDRFFEERRDPNVSATGAVGVSEPFFKAASACVVPLLFESGTRFKILEAGLHSVPVVSTTLGAEGLHVTNGVHLLIADKPEAFSRAILSILETSEYPNMGRELHKLVGERYGVDQLKYETRTILSKWTEA